MALLWGGLALSSVGDQAHAVAFAWIAVKTFGAVVGWLVELGPLVLLVTLLFGGQLAECSVPI